jgi:hypothetical protein
MRHRQTRPIQERQAPFYVGIDIGKSTHHAYVHHAYVMDAEGTPCIPKVVAFAKTCAGYTQLFTMLTEATAQAGPTEMTVGCEATGP